MFNKNIFYLFENNKINIYFGGVKIMAKNKNKENKQNKSNSNKSNKQNGQTENMQDNCR